MLYTKSETLCPSSALTRSRSLANRGRSFLDLLPDFAFIGDANWKSQFSSSLRAKGRWFTQHTCNQGNPPILCQRPTWVWMDSISVNSFWCWLPIGLWWERAESIHPNRGGYAGDRGCADPWRCACTWAAVERRHKAGIKKINFWNDSKSQL